MRILLITNNYPLSATTSTWAPFCIRDLALALARAGAEVLVVAPDHADEQEIETGVAVRRIPWSGRDEMDLISLKLNSIDGLRHAASLFLNGRRHLSTVYREVRPDFCLAAWALPSGEFARYGKRKYGVPYAVWCLGSDIHTWARKPFFRGLTRRVLAAADLRYADGFALAREAEELCGLSCDFLATTRSMSSKTTEPTAWDPGKRHFLFVGRWEAVKGLDILLDAWRKLVLEGRALNAVLHIVGQGTGLEPMVSGAAGDATLKDSLDVLGWVTQEQLAGLYAATDYVVIPSRNESIPVVLSEALSNGKPLIVTDVGDMGELVDKYRLGRVVPAESVDDLAEALADVINSGHVLDSDMLAAVGRLFDVDQVARQFLSDVAALTAAPVAARGAGSAGAPS